MLVLGRPSSDAAHAAVVAHAFRFFTRPRHAFRSQCWVRARAWIAAVVAQVLCPQLLSVGGNFQLVTSNVVTASFPLVRTMGNIYLSGMPTAVFALPELVSVSSSVVCNVSVSSPNSLVRGLPDSPAPMQLCLCAGLRHWVAFRVVA